MSAIQLSPLLKAMHVSSSAISAQNQRVLLISQNLAHSGMRTSTKETPYERQVMSFKTVYDKGLGIELIKTKALTKDKSSFKRIYAPEDPVADENGYILETNVNPATEISDLREAGRGHEASLRAFEKVLGMLQNIIGLLKHG
jgi:flagellar basal-body rod protein FlgC